MGKKANINLQIFGAGILMTHLTALVQESDGVRAGKDIEAVHRMRVASRRLRATLPLFGPHLAGKRHLLWIKSVRSITRALGEARDSDVQIDHVNRFLETLQPPNRAGVRRLLLRLRQQRLALQPKVLKALDKFEKSGLVSEMAQKLAPFDIYRDRLDSNDPVLIEMADQAIRTRLGEFLAFDEIVPQPDKVQELHAMRIAAKRLRYTLETFAPLFEDGLKTTIKSMRASQDMLGEIHDSDVWDVTMQEFMDEERLRTIEYFGTARPYKRLAPGLLLYQEARRSERNSIYEIFTQSWEQWKNEGLWDDLTALLDARLASVAVSEEPDEPVPSVEEAVAEQMVKSEPEDSPGEDQDQSPVQ
ncbi:MAG: CHAD domain-containing protein [Bellilinea sp.]